MEWDEFTDLATAAYNFVPNVTSKEAPFFLMFGQDPYMPLNQLISQARRYPGNDEGIPNLETLQNLLQMTTAQIEYAATRRNQSFKPVKPHDFKVGDLVLVRNHTSKTFEEKYQDSFHVVWPLGKNQLEVKDQKGHIRQVHVTNVKKTTMVEIITNTIPDYTAFGHAVKLQLNPNKVEDLQWTIPEKVSNVQVDETSIEGETTSQQTSQGESNDPSEPVTTSFWSITEKIKQGLHQHVTSINTQSLLGCSDQPL